MKESAVQKKLMVAINDRFGTDIYLRKIHQSMYSHAGIPDVLVCYRGKLVGIEIKTLTGKPTKLQWRELKLIREAGGVATICFGVEDIERVIKMIEDIN